MLPETGLMTPQDGEDKRLYWQNFQNMLGELLGALTLGKIAMHIGVTILASSALILWYAIDRGIPYFEIISTMGGGIAIVSILSYTTAILFVVIFLFPGLFRLLDPAMRANPASLSSDHEAQARWNRERWAWCVVPAMLAYIHILIPIAYSEYSEPANAAPIVLFCRIGITALGLRLILPAVWWEISYTIDLLRFKGRRHHNDLLYPQYICLINMVIIGYIIMLFPIAIKFASSIVHDAPPELKINDANKMQITIALGIALDILFVGIVSLAVDRRSFTRASAVAGIMLLTLTFGWPRAPLFIDRAFRWLMVGGEIEVTLYVEAEAACRFPALLIEEGSCKSDQHNQIRLRPAPLAFTSNETYFVRTTENKEKSRSTIAIPKKFVRMIEYSEK